MKNYKVLLLLLFLLFVYTFFCAITYANVVSNDISENVFRLHVIANSDSDEDQNLKYLVRDSLLNYMEELSKDCKSKDEVISIAKEHSSDFKSIAVNTIRENGYDYDVSINIGNFDFPTKTYGDISLPSGNYDALRVEIGEAKGKNWWCVMFPPLCFIDISSGVVPEDSKDYLKENMSEEEYKLISSEEDNVFNLKFKLLEFFANNHLIS